MQHLELTSFQHPYQNGRGSVASEKVTRERRKTARSGPSTGPHGSDNLPGMAAVCGILAADQERKENVPTGRLGGASAIRTVGIDLANVASRPSWITVTRGLAPRALEHACRRPRLRAGPAAWRGCDQTQSRNWNSGSELNVHADSGRARGATVLGSRASRGRVGNEVEAEA
jgi:hypothetical protein